MTFFYDLNKRLNGIRELPENTHKQLNERDMSRAAKGIEKYGKDGMQALAKAGREGKALDPVRNKYDKYDEGQPSQDAMKLNPDFAQIGKKPGVMGKIAQGVKRVADFVAPGDEDLMRDLERKSGGRRPAKEAAAPMTPKQKSFAKLAPPADKITFADKIAGAKKEVDEMLGDVAAEAMKAALGKGKQPTMGEATKEIPGGRRHTSEPGGYGRRDDDNAPKVQTQRGRGRPKKNADSETGEVMKPDWSAFGATGKDVKLPKHTGAVTKHKMVGETVSEDDIKVLERLMDEAFTEGNNALGNAIQGVLERIQGDQDEGQYDDDEQVNEKSVSKKQQKFMGMVHAAKKGEKPASKEVAKAAKGISGKEAEKFASTKHKGLPDKVKEQDTDTRDTKAEKAGKKVTQDIEYDEKAKDGDHGSKRGPQDARAEKAGKRVAKDIEHDEKVDETTTSGSVAPAAGGKKSSGGTTFGKGIYDSWNRELEGMITENINISVNMSNGSETGSPTKNITVSADGDDADKLAELLQMAGMGSSTQDTQVSSCGAEQMDENQPDWPTDTEYSDDAFQYSGGLNKPKSTGQTTTPVIADQASRQDSYADEEEDAIKRMMEMAGVKKKEVDEEKTEEGNKFTGNLAKARADGKKQADLDGDGDMEKVQENMVSLSQLFRSFK